MPQSPRRALLWSLAERYAGFIVGLATTLILARLLTPAEVGVYSVCAAFSAMAALLRDFGVSEYLIQERELTPEKLRSAMAVALVMAWTLGVLVLVLRDPAARFFGEPAVAAVLTVMALNFFILPLSSPAFAMLNRELAFRQIFFLQTVCTVVHGTTALTLAGAGFGPMALAWAPVAAVVAQTTILAVIRPRETFVMPSTVALRPVLKFGMTYMTSRTVENLAENAHEPIIAKVFGFASLGLFSRAMGMVDLFRKNVTDAFVRVATPAFAARHRAGQPVDKALLHATTVFTALSWPFFGFIALAAPEILRVLFGPAWAGAAPLATILALAAMPGALCEFVPQMLSTTGHVARRLRLALAGSAIHIAAVAGAAWWGLQAMAAAFVVSSLAILVLNAFHLRAAIGLPLSALPRAAASSATLALLCAAAAGAVLWATRAAALPGLFGLLAAGATGALTWLAVAKAVRHPAVDELHVAVGILRGRGSGIY